MLLFGYYVNFYIMQNMKISFKNMCPSMGGRMEFVMEFTQREFMPVLFGNDINVYSVARAFYEAYGIQSVVFGKALMGTCYKSKMVKFKEIKNLDDPEVMLNLLNDFALENTTKKIIAIGCGDNYVKCLAKNKGMLKSNIIVPYTDYDFLEELMDKEKFYNICEKHGIEYPKTYICTVRDYEDIKLFFEPPYILKPANQVEYYKNKFEGQKKVFKLNTKRELRETVKKIYEAGYTDNMIIQDFLPGDDTYMRVLTSYSDKNGKVKMMCLGHVLLEEHTPYGIGNHAVIITEYEEELMDKFKKFLEDIHFTGFSNFDIKYDMRDNKYKVFEINPRQGRSNFYVTGSGHNIAKLLVEDFIYNNPIEEDIAKNEYLWMVVPKGVAYKYAPEYKDRMKRLVKEKRYVNPLKFAPDNDPERIYRLMRSQLGHYVKFKKYYK